MTVTDSGPALDVLTQSIDVDSHEMAPTHVWGEMFGENSSRFADAAMGMLSKLGDNSVVYPGIRDDAEINAHSVWNAKGPTAPGAFDFQRRIEVLDVMGTQRQLVFPTSALLSFTCLLDRGGRLRRMFGLDDTPEVSEMLWGVIREYNRWAVRTTAEHADRYRAATLMVAHSVDDLMREATDMVASGARAIWLPDASPPGGVSPADHALDPFWSLLEEADVAATLHIGTQSGFRASEQWAKVLPEFEPVKLDSAEITFEPFTATSMYMVPSNFLIAMVMGGVFERHPNLRFGALEQGASWLGSLAEHLDAWATGPFRKRMATILSMPPSGYFARNVRVTPFYFEPIDVYLERYPGLVDCYAYSSDYPHQEGGPESKARLFEKIRPFGDEVVRKFFVDNGEWLLPA
jgi:predicted TIM-barrel fold metal-dependent hydrolase